MITKESFRNQRSSQNGRRLNFGDTNLGHVDMEEFKERMLGYNLSKMAKRMVRNGIVQAVGFPRLQNNVRS